MRAHVQVNDPSKSIRYERQLQTQMTEIFYDKGYTIVLIYLPGVRSCDIRNTEIYFQVQSCLAQMYNEKLIIFYIKFYEH